MSVELPPTLNTLADGDQLIATKPALLELASLDDSTLEACSLLEDSALLDASSLLDEASLLSLLSLETLDSATELEEKTELEDSVLDITSLLTADDSTDDEDKLLLKAEDTAELTACSLLLAILDTWLTTLDELLTTALLSELLDKMDDALELTAELPPLEPPPQALNHSAIRLTDNNCFFILLSHISLRWQFLVLIDKPR